MPLQSNFKYSWSDKVLAPIITVRCRKVTAELDKQRFGSGSKGKCIKYKDEWLTPSDFEVKCGLLGSRDWKRSLHCEGRRLRCLIEDEILKPHSKACSCSLCCDDESSDQPIKYFIEPKRKIRATGHVIRMKKMGRSMNRDKRDTKKSEPIRDDHSSSNNHSMESFTECLDGVMSKIDELKSTVKNMKEEFNKRLLESRQKMERDKQKEIEAIQIKAKLFMEKRLADEKQLMDIQLQEALAQIRQELTEKFAQSK